MGEPEKEGAKTINLAERRVFSQRFKPLYDEGMGLVERAAEYLDREGRAEAKKMSRVAATLYAAESMRLNNVSGAVIMAGSGMCEGGRVRHHLIHNLGRADSSVLFVGYQAKGTLGRSIVDGAQRVRISGHDVAVRAHVARIDSYSAHADRQDILDWIGGRKPVAGGVFLNHGEAPALESLRKTLEPDQRVVVPAIGEHYRLMPGQPAKRLSTGDASIQAVLSGDWQNDYADFAVNLKRELQRIRDEDARRAALRRMRAVLAEYGEHRQRAKEANRSGQQRERKPRRRGARA